MSTSLTKHKKIALSLLLIALVIAGVFGAWHGVGVAHAQTTNQPAAPTTGNSTLAETQQGGGTWYFAIILGILLIIRTLLVWILTFAGYILDIMFVYNIELVPSLQPVVQTGWVVLRDLANGVFILLVLWIALTIILGIEQYGGKKLLVKVLVVAILINFSLAGVTAIIALSNEFARAFYNKIGLNQDHDLAGMIINATKVQSVTENLDKASRDKLNLSLENQLAQSQTQPISYHKDVFFAAFGVQPAQAGLAEACPAWLPPCWAVKATLKYNPLFAPLKSLDSAIPEIKTANVQQIILTAFGIVILSIITSAFVYAAVALAIRYLAIILISISAPIAIIALVMPLATAKEAWGKWSHALFKWSFFAPAFYFLMYLTLLMAVTFDNQFKTPLGTTDVKLDPRRLWALAIIVIMFHFTAKFAKDTAGKAGTIAVDSLKKISGLAVGVTAGVATGGTLMAARAVARGAAKEGGIAERMAGNKFGRMMGGGALLRKGVQEREAQKERIAEREKKYANYSVSQMQAEVKGSSLIYSEENAARIVALAKKKDGFKGFSESQLATSKSILTRYNQGGLIAKVKPTLADEKTIGATGREEIAKPGYGAPGVTSKEAKAVQYAGEHLTGKELDENFDGNELIGADEKNRALREGMVRNSNFTQKRLENLVQTNFQAALDFVATQSTFLTKLNTDIADIDRQIAAPGVTAAQVATLNTQRSGLQRERGRVQGIQTNLSSTPGGRALGLISAPLTLTGSSIITGSPTSLAVDVKSRIRGGSGKYEFLPTTTPGFQISPAGILTTTAPLPASGSRPTISIQVKDKDDPNSPPTTIDLTAVIS